MQIKRAFRWWRIETTFSIIRCYVIKDLANGIYSNLCVHTIATHFQNLRKINHSNSRGGKKIEIKLG